MSWLFSQALVAGFLEATSSAGEPSAPSSGNHTQQVYLSPDKTTVISRLSRFGMTCRPLTVERGEELLTLFRAAFPVKTSQSQGRATGLMASGQECGERWRGSWVKFDPSTSLWRTHQCSLLGDLTEFSETWPNWGLMRNGECWEQQTLAPTISETASGFWPTPVASMSKGSSPNSLIRKNGRDRAKDRLDHAVMASDGGHLNPTWVEWLMGWPIEWTDLKPLATDKFQEWQQQHSPLSQTDTLHLASNQKHTFGK